MAGQGKTVARSEFDELVARNQELEMLIQDMAADLSALNRAQLAACGVDPGVAARKNLRRRTVQFTRNYNRLSQPSSVPNGPNLVEGYTVAAFEVVKIREDEFLRINADFPGLMVEAVDEFKPRPAWKSEPDKDAAGRFRWKLTPVPIPVDVLIERAPSVG